jgi:hypothetical protein
MSCGDGNRFVCGIKRYEKHKISVIDKPTNNVLYNDNNKKLEQLMTERSLQDKGIFNNSFVSSQKLVTPLNRSFSTYGSQIVNNSSKSFDSLYQNNTTQKQDKNKSLIQDRIIDFDNYLKVD